MNKQLEADLQMLSVNLGILGHFSRGGHCGTNGIDDTEEAIARVTGDIMRTLRRIRRLNA